MEIENGNINYKIGSEIGKGVFGRVFKVGMRLKIGDNFTNNREVAMKVIKKASLNDVTCANLRQEVHVLKTVQSPNIISLIDVFEDEDFVYIITEFCNGGDLSRVLDLNNRLTKKKLIQRILVQVIKGLKALHEQGVIHRDVKAPNILLHFPNSKQKDIRF
jgi:serine/threonine protein kinase